MTLYSVGMNSLVYGLMEALVMIKGYRPWLPFSLQHR